MDLVMVRTSGGESFTPREVMVRIPEPDAVKLEEEAKKKGKKLATYCREILIEHLKEKGKQEELLPVIKRGVREVLISDDLDDEFRQKLANVMSKQYK